MRPTSSALRYTSSRIRASFLRVAARAGEGDVVVEVQIDRAAPVLNSTPNFFEPRRAAAFAKPTIWSPSTQISPRSGLSRPEDVLQQHRLPRSRWARMAVIRPLGTSKVMSSSTVCGTERLGHPSQRDDRLPGRHPGLQRFLPLGVHRRRTGAPGHAGAPVSLPPAATPPSVLPSPPSTPPAAVVVVVVEGDVEPELDEPPPLPPRRPPTVWVTPLSEPPTAPVTPPTVLPSPVLPVTPPTVLPSPVLPVTPPTALADGAGHAADRLADGAGHAAHRLPSPVLPVTPPTVLVTPLVRRRPSWSHHCPRRRWGGRVTPPTVLVTPLPTAPVTPPTVCRRRSPPGRAHS